MPHHILVSEFYKSLFGTKVYKISIDAGCTCPTRDGTKGFGGCIFCSANGSGDFVPSNKLSITEQIGIAKQLVSKKLKAQNQPKYIVYFQNFTNTYGDLEKLQRQWKEALSCADIVGIAIGTRPDCLSAECLEILGKMAEQTYVQVELGFQTSCAQSVEYIRRGFENEVYSTAVKKLHSASKKIHVVTHVIFGLPQETKEIMMDSLKFALSSGTDGIKIMNLYILQGTDLAKDYEKGCFSALEMEEYFDLLRTALKLIPQNIIIHRLTGDPPKKLLIAPKWVENKKLVLNRINQLISFSEPEPNLA
ncbi:MAG: TIGR01212 family radical SAM protein [Treponema sp.]|nr:TIGR01212 family radical SAM protein [Treponema sp.]